MDQNNFNAVENQQIIVSDAQKAEIQNLADSAFGKGLAATIISELPIGSIIAIILGSTAENLAASADSLAEKYGTSAGGKKIAGKVLGKIGKIVGIVMTIFWAVYIPFCFLIGFLSAL